MPSSACEIPIRSEEHTSELQSLRHLVCRLLLDKPIRSEEHTSELQSLRHFVCRLLLDKKRCAGRTQEPVGCVLRRVADRVVAKPVIQPPAVRDHFLFFLISGSHCRPAFFPEKTLPR